jgi:hypothetical protein
MKLLLRNCSSWWRKISRSRIKWKDLRTIAREYISNLNNLEVLYNSRQSSLFDLITRVVEIEKLVL